MKMSLSGTCILKINDVDVLMRENRIDLCSLCTAGGKEYKRWRELKATNKLLEFMCGGCEISADQLLLKEHRGTQRLIWAPVTLAVNCAHWISHELGMKVQDFFDDVKVDEYETSISKLNQAHAQLSEELVRVEHLRRNILLKKQHKKFKTKNCFYIISDTYHTCNEIDRAYKFGITGDINKRLQTYRTAMVSPQIFLLIFLQQITKYFLHSNHEHISGVTIEEVRTYLENFVAQNLLSHVFSDDDSLLAYNEQMLTCNTDLEG